MSAPSPISTGRTLLLRGRPQSPRDTVPIIANGQPIDRASLPPISGVRPVQATSPTLVLSPTTSPSPLPFNPAPTPVVVPTPHVQPSSAQVQPSSAHVQPSSAHVQPSSAHVQPSSAHVQPNPQMVTVSPIARGPVRLLQTPGRRVIYRVARGQAQARLLPLPAGLVRDNRPDYSSMSLDDQYRYQALILAKYNTLRTTNSWLNIPALDHSLTLDQKHDQYLIYHRQVSIHLAANRYKQYLRLGFKLFELFCTKFLNLRVLEGYSEAQEANFILYEDYLQAMAEKNYDITGTPWPPEVRLIVASLIQAALFALVSWVGTYLGKSQFGPVVNTITGFFHQSGPSANRTTSGLPEPPRPEGFDLESILNMAQTFLGTTSNRPPAPRRPAFDE